MSNKSFFQENRSLCIELGETLRKMYGCTNKKYPKKKFQVRKVWNKFFEKLNDAASNFEDYSEGRLLEVGVRFKNSMEYQDLRLKGISELCINNIEDTLNVCGFYNEFPRFLKDALVESTKYPLRNPPNVMSTEDYVSFVTELSEKMPDFMTWHTAQSIKAKLQGFSSVEEMTIWMWSKAS